jgi:peptidoglycan/xylan/chitin deacetylase (PgdA/CDA1 family)
MSAGQLLRHLDWMATGRVKVVSLLDLVDTDEDVDSIALTFDDGLTNFGEVAAPLLVERGLPAIVFISPAHVGTANTWDDANRPTIPRLSLLSWDEIRALSQQGFEFGGHGNTHIALSGLSESVLESEVAECSKRITAEVGRKPRAFAYPYGKFDEQAIAAVAELFDTACTTELRPVASNDSRHALPRLDMYYFNDVSIKDMWGTRAFAPYVRLRAAGRALRSSLGRKL